MVLYVSSEDCTGSDGGPVGAAGSEVMVALGPGRGSHGAPHGLWRYVCCQKRPTLTSCRYTTEMGAAVCVSVGKDFISSYRRRSCS